VGRQGHEDTLTLRVELASGTDATGASRTLESAMREVMKLRGSVDVVASGTIPENAKKISDERKWD
jgi:phenylacetate-CoA ligase